MARSPWPSARAVPVLCRTLSTLLSYPRRFHGNRLWAESDLRFASIQGKNHPSGGVLSLNHSRGLSAGLIRPANSNTSGLQNGENMGAQYGIRKSEQIGATYGRPEGFEGDILLPVQYYGRVAGKRATTGEFKLFFAILEDALRCYVRCKGCRSRAERVEFLDVRAWFHNLGAPHVFSFDSTCALLDIDPQCLRTRLNSLTELDLPRKQFRTHRRHPRGLSAHSRESNFTEATNEHRVEVITDSGLSNV